MKHFFKPNYKNNNNTSCTIETTVNLVEQK